jgi:hypothetical protein
MEVCKCVDDVKMCCQGRWSGRCVDDIVNIFRHI